MAGYKPIWRVLITPVGGMPQDISYYVSDGGGGGGSVIDVQDATTDRASTFTISLWDHDDSGLLTQFGIGDEVEIWSDTQFSQSYVPASATVSTTGVSLPVKSWATITGNATCKTSTSMDGENWTPFVEQGPNGQVMSPPYRWIRIDSGMATVNYLAMPKRLVGIVNNVQTGQDGPSVKTVTLSGQDWTTKLLNVLVSRAYRDQAAEAVIIDLLQAYFPDITYNNVQSGAGNIAYIKFNHMKGFDAFGKLANITGWDWFVDENKDFHWFPASSRANSIVLSTTGVNANIERGSAKFQIDGTQLQNKITFYGGQYQSAPRDEYRTGDGQSKTWMLTYNLATFVHWIDAGDLNPQTPLVWVNGVSRTVGEDGVDSGCDFYMKVGERYIKQDDAAAPLGPNDTLHVQYTYHIPLIIQQQVDDSITKYGVFEGAITDQSLTDRDTARAMVSGQLQQSAWPIIYGTCDTWEPTFASGQMVTFNMPDQGVNNQQLKLTQVHHQISSDEYQVSITAYGQAR